MEFFPLPAFNFFISPGFDVGPGFEQGLPCVEVSGIGVEYQMEDLIDGGTGTHTDNNVKQRTKYSNIVVKKAIYENEGSWAAYRTTHFNAKEDDIEQLFKKSAPGGTKIDMLQVMLRSEKGVPKLTWSFMEAYAIKWQIDGFNSMESKVAMETITFSCKTIRIS